jgi:hypothetical protein
VIVCHGNAEQLELPAATFGLLADSGTTRGTLGADRLSLGTGADGATPPESRSWEPFYLVDVAMEFLFDARVSVGEAGELVLVLPRVPHAFGAAPVSTADVLVLVAPGVAGFGYFRHLQRIALGQEPAESLAPVQDRYDVHFVDSGAWTTTRTPGKSTRASTFG